MQDPKWIGRFAPSPTGSLHLGSLVAALASYMIAKQKGGRWLVRIEDLDPPREIPGASHSILTTLEDFGLYWDGEVMYQSQQNSSYQQRLKELIGQQIVYQCDCSRKQIEQRHQGIYDGFCRHRAITYEKDQAVRVKFSSGFESFYDEILADCRFNSKSDRQDFIVKRRDGLFAYQLAVVVDDIEQGVNHVVRGQDILDSTPRQNFLYHCFGHSVPKYYHLPLVKTSRGIKFSKRISSTPVDKNIATTVLLQALQHLGQDIDKDMASARPTEVINYYLKHWQTNKINQSYKLREIK